MPVRNARCGQLVTGQESSELTSLLLVRAFSTKMQSQFGSNFEGMRNTASRRAQHSCLASHERQKHLCILVNDYSTLPRLRKANLASQDCSPGGLASLAFVYLAA